MTLQPRKIEISDKSSPKNYEKIRFVDLFAGIGGFHLALKSLNMKCVFACEIDKFARQTYLKNFNDKFLKYMNRNKIFPQYHYIPIFKFKLFKGSFIGKNSNKYFNHAISLPIFVDLDKKKQIYIVNKINNFFKTKK